MRSIAIIGSRTILETDKNVTKVICAVEKYIGWQHVIRIVSGGAKGADKLAELAYQRAVKKMDDIDLLIHHADWDKYGKSAGPKRNALIATDADICFAFIDKPLFKSFGTCNCVSLFKSKTKPVHIIRMDL